MDDLVNISIPTAAGTALLGYLVVFFGLVLLMCVLLVMGAVNTRKAKKLEAAQAIPAPDRAAPVLSLENTMPKAKGTAGELKLYNTDPRDAAMIMAIVADSLGKPLNELRFISIREVE
jgi:Na+-transporting methylmalonyl-CoA/oxaloacetate decarboxylase gamma subunit